MELNLQALFEYLTFWRIVTTIIVYFTLRIALAYLKVWLYLNDMRKKYGAKTYFIFPVGLPQRIQNDPDSLDFSKEYM
eukprot:CAMPEP_0176433484 /NCGR_PEP_ID=MMETSP0127-20121128/16049_1 /TAXON_ID=938130 /ORGANISM="Platyophrya macrostoma, Strain WH" /LENGTH=77 /DNA_ID=CAMNT_0017815919 /DNA_START=18 /DNA_END=248 /DNA_ORIENTATION=+